MAYSYDQHRPIEIDSARMDLDDQAEALRSCAPTVPATLDDQPHERPWLGAVAAASQAPRIPRVSKRQDAPMCVAGTCRQGRARCARPELCSGHVDRDQDASQSFPPGRMNDLGHAVALWLCVVVLCVMVPALAFRVTWADAVQLLAVIGGAR